MALFQNKPASTALKTNYLAEIKCGRMKFDKETKMVTPEEQKGLLFVERGVDDSQFIHLCWKSREKGKTTEKLEDWLIFQNDVKVKLITQLPEHRVFFIKFNATNERHFFWIQHNEKEKDIGQIEKIDMAMNNTSELEKLNREKEKEAGKSKANALGDLSIPGIPKELQNMLANDPSSAGMVQQLLQMQPDALRSLGLGGEGGSSGRGKSGSIMKGGSSKPSSAGGKKKSVTMGGQSGASGAGASASGATTLNDLEKALAMVTQASNDAIPKFNLPKALNKDSIIQSLDKPENQERMKKHMPESDKIEKTPGALKNIVSTPQYQQAVGAFQEALESRQLGQVLAHGFDIPASAVKAAETGNAKEFAEALEKELCKENKKDEEGKNGESKPKEEEAEKSEESSKSKDDEADKMAVD